MNNAIDEFEYKFERDIFPQVISVGHCINVRNCKATNVDLADGWCVNCWDKGETAKNNIRVAIRQREQEKESQRLLRVTKKAMRELNKKNLKRGRHRKNCACPTHKNKGLV